MHLNLSEGYSTTMAGDQLQSGFGLIDELRVVGGTDSSDGVLVPLRDQVLSA